MRVSPVSFKSLMVFTLPDDKPSLETPQLMQLSFEHNKNLQNYYLTDLVHYNEKIDGTVHNAAADFAEKLDEQYKEKLPKGSKKVMFTEADFYVNPRETQKRYFLTAATNEDEEKLHRVLSKSSAYYTVKFRNKMH